MYNHKQTVDTPTLVIAGKMEEYERYCMERGIGKSQALLITNPEQFKHYPMDCPIALTGTFWLNNCYGSQELKEREAHLDELADKQKRGLITDSTPSSTNFVADGSAMAFGNPGASVSKEQRYRNALVDIITDKGFDPQRLRDIATEALKD